VLAPVGEAEFLGSHWGRRPLVVPRADPGRFDGLLSVADVERLVCGSGLRAPAFRLVKDGAPLPLAGYTEDISWRPGVLSHTARPDRVAEEFANGATIVVQALQIHWLATARFCRGLEMALGCPVQANAYYTPAAAQGFAVHHDTHDVLVLQVAGAKRWRLYEPLLEQPLKHQRWSPELGDPGEPVEDFTLAPGDTLYLPRGHPHEAFTSDAASLHITVGLQPPTRLDALRDALEAGAAADPELRVSLDGELPGDLLERLAARLAPEDVARRARRRFIATRRPILPDQLTQLAALPDLTAGDLVERRDTVIAELDDSGVLYFEGKELRLPARARAALRHACEAREPFAAAALPGLDEAGALVLVRRLVREGFLRIVIA
jgi:ribosomal protein L16 Arg81 hydroxylase